MPAVNHNGVCWICCTHRANFKLCSLFNSHLGFLNSLEIKRLSSFFSEFCFKHIYHIKIFHFFFILKFWSIFKIIKVFWQWKTTVVFNQSMFYLESNWGVIKFESSWEFVLNFLFLLVVEILSFYILWLIYLEFGCMRLYNELLVFELKCLQLYSRVISDLRYICCELLRLSW